MKRGTAEWVRKYIQCLRVAEVKTPDVGEENQPGVVEKKSEPG